MNRREAMIGSACAAVAALAGVKPSAEAEAFAMVRESLANIDGCVVNDDDTFTFTLDVTCGEYHVGKYAIPGHIYRHRNALSVIMLDQEVAFVSWEGVVG